MNYNKVCLFFFILCEVKFNCIKELETLNQKMADQMRIEQTYDESQEQRIIRVKCFTFEFPIVFSAK